jgi:hypothetical protein
MQRSLSVPLPGNAIPCNVHPPIGKSHITKLLNLSNIRKALVQGERSSGSKREAAQQWLGLSLYPAGLAAHGYALPGLEPLEPGLASMRIGWSSR